MTKSTKPASTKPADVAKGRAPEVAPKSIAAREKALASAQERARADEAREAEASAAAEPAPAPTPPAAPAASKTN